MKRLDILNKIRKVGIIAVVRADTPDIAFKICKSIIEGGIKGVELTFTIPEVEEVLKKLATEYGKCSDIVVGAGSVLDETTARLAIMSGAEYIVSPCFDKRTAEICNLYQIPYLPGCMTITEMRAALCMGVDIVKLFPSSLYNPKIIPTIHAPLPQLNIMPTGGIGLDNMSEWFKSGAVAVGVGGNLLAPAKNGEFGRITENAKEYIERYKQIVK